MTEFSERRKDYSEEEASFQKAQDSWEKNRDKNSWEMMFSLVLLAVFNCVNKKLEGKLEKEEIEQRSLDVAMNIMEGIRKKAAAGEAWKIQKLSSFVYLPCLSVYSKKQEFEDKILPSEKYMRADSSGVESVRETANTESVDGIIRLKGCPKEPALDGLSEILSDKASLEFLSEAASKTSMAASGALRNFRGEIRTGETEAQCVQKLKNAMADAQIALNTVRTVLGIDMETMTKAVGTRLRYWNKASS